MMKNKSLVILFLALAFALNANGQKPAPADELPGKWKFEAPSAPEGFTSGNIDISFVENVYKVSLAFTGSDYKLDGDRAAIVDGSFMFVVYLQGQEITIVLRMEGKDKMNGLAIHPDGEVPLVLVRNTDKKQIP